MIGSMPVPPTYAAPPMYAPGGYAMPSAPAAYRALPAPAAPRPPAAPAVAQAPRPNNGLIVRGQRPDDPIEPPAPPRRAPEPVRLPSPEELGVGVGQPAEAGIDWAVVNRRLEALGTVCFQMNKLPQGGWRVTCLVPTGQPDRTRRVEAEAGARADAVRLALEQAEQGAAAR
jgi:hypothetical protein